MFRNFDFQENDVTKLKDILTLLENSTEEEIKKYNFEKLEKGIILKFEDDELDIELAYKYAEYNEDFKIMLDDILMNEEMITTTRCQYLLSMNTTDEEFINLSIKAIEGLLIEEETQLKLINKIKKIAIERDLYDEIVDGIKTCGDVNTIVCAALSYESKLIDEIFGGKINMYLYLKHATFTDSECLDLYIDKLFKMDNNKLENYIKNNIKTIQKRINKKL